MQLSSKSDSGLGSLPISRGSILDSEFESLLREYPREARQYVDQLYNIGDVSKRSQLFGQGNNEAPKPTYRPSQKDSKTHYQETFVYNEIDPKPRSSKKPVPELRNPNRQPMTFDTWQKSSYKPIDFDALHKNGLLAVKANKVSDAENILQGNNEIESETSYRKFYTPKKLDTEDKFTLNKSSSKSGMMLANKENKHIPFECETTSGEHYKQWELHPVTTYGELPSFTGSILFPTNKREFQTTMQAAYKGQKGSPVQLTRLEQQNLQLSGDYDFATTHRNAFKQLDVEKPILMKGVASQQQLPVITTNRASYETQTQAMRDFPGFGSRQPSPPKPILPLAGRLDLRYDNKGYYDTEQRQVYHGHDTRQFPVRKPFQPASDSNIFKSASSFENESVTKRDYPALNPLFYQEHVVTKPKESAIGVATKSYDGHLSSLTTNRELFKDWSNQMTPHVRCFDRQEDFRRGYIVSGGNDDNDYNLLNPIFTSETKSVFVTPDVKPEHAVHSYKPVVHSIETLGDRNLTTVYRSEFKNKKYKLTKAEAKDLKQKLLQLKQTNKKEMTASV